MAQSIFSFEITGFDKLAAVLRPELFQKLLVKHVGRATGRNAALAARQMRMTIRTQGAGAAIVMSGGGQQQSHQKLAIPPNRPLTVAIKKSSKPLVDGGDLFQAITHKRIDHFTGFAGVLRTTAGFNIAQTIHEGVKIPVTAEMRNMFMALHRVSIGKASPGSLTGRAAELWKRNQTWFPLKPSTNVIVIPARPFVNLAIANADLVKKMQQNWELAMADVFGDIRRSFYR